MASNLEKTQLKFQGDVPFILEDFLIAFDDFIETFLLLLLLLRTWIKERGNIGPGRLGRNR